MKILAVRDPVPDMKRQLIRVMALGTLMLVLALPSRGMCAGVDTAVANGNTYTCYFLSSLDIVMTDISFGERGGMEFSSFDGNGFYFTLTNYFAGSYWSLNAKIGARTGDILFFLFGNTFDPFMYGTGIMVYEYSEIYGMVFFGFRSVET